MTEALATKWFADWPNGNVKYTQYNGAMSQELREANGAVLGSTQERQASPLSIIVVLISEPWDSEAVWEGQYCKHLATRLELSMGIDTYSRQTPTLGTNSHIRVSAELHSAGDGGVAPLRFWAASCSCLGVLVFQGHCSPSLM